MNKKILVIIITVCLLILIFILLLKFNILKLGKEKNETTSINETSKIISKEEKERRSGLWYAIGGSIVIMLIALIFNKVFRGQPILMEGLIEDQNLDDVKKAIIKYWADEYKIVVDGNGNTEQLEFLDTALDKKGQDENFMLFNILVTGGTKVGYHFLKVKLNQPLENIEVGKFEKHFNMTMYTYKRVPLTKDWRERDITSQRLRMLSEVPPEQIQPEIQQQLLREIIRPEEREEEYIPKPFKSTKESESI